MLLFEEVPPPATPYPPPPTTCGPVDLVFVIDDTGSMGGAINNVKAGIGGIVDDVVAQSGGDYQLGLLTFKDIVTTRNPLASGNELDVQTNIGGLFASGGNRWPEASDMAVEAALGFGTWRADAVKVIVLVTDAPPGQLEDDFTPAAESHAYDLGWQARDAGIRIVSIYVPTFSDPITRAIMHSYADRSGGIFSETARDGSGTAAAISNALHWCWSDVFMKDNNPDIGAEPSTPPVWLSPDIKVCREAVECSTSQRPLAGATNYVFVTLRYRSGTTGYGTLRLYYTRAGGSARWDGTITDSWTDIGSADNVVVAPGATVTVMIPWENTPGPAHFCLLARWESLGDPMRVTEGPNTLQNTINNNNIAWRNVDSVGLPVDRGSTVKTLPFFVRSPADVRIPLALLLSDGGSGFTNHGTLVVDLGAQLYERWQAAGRPGENIIPLDGTRVQVTDLRRAWIDGMWLDPQEDLEINLSFGSKPGVGLSSHTVQVVQYGPPSDAKGNPISGKPLEDIGGLAYNIVIDPLLEETPEPTPPPQPTPTPAPTPSNLGFRLYTPQVRR